MSARALFVLFTALLGIGCGQPKEGVSTSPQQPNLIYILFDDLGYADLDLPAYSGTIAAEKRIQTPRLREFAEEGIHLTSAYSDGTICSPTRVATLTGMRPARLGVFRVAGPASLGIPRDVPTLPRLLSENGYFTIHVGKWHAGWGKDHFRPAGVGFRQVIELLYGSRYPGSPHPAGHQNRTLRIDGQDVRAPGLLSRNLIDQAIGALRQRANSPETPFFLNLWLYAPHLPLDGSTEQWRDHYGCAADDAQCLYAAMVSTVDEQIGRLLDALDELALRENTLVVIASDNGGAWERELPAMREGPTNGPLLGHKRSFFEGGLRVPFLARLPEKIPAGSRSDTLALSADLVPTVLDLLDIEPPADLDGVSLLPTLMQSGPQPSRDEPVFWVSDLKNAYLNLRKENQITHRFAVRDDPWKLVYDVSPGHPYREEKPRLRLFDLRGPLQELEREDLIEQQPEIARRLWDAYWNWFFDATKIPLAEAERRGDLVRLAHDDRFDALSGMGLSILFDMPSIDPEERRNLRAASTGKLLVERKGILSLEMRASGRLRLQISTTKEFTLKTIDTIDSFPASRIAVTTRYWKHANLTSVRIYFDDQLQSEKHVEGRIPIPETPTPFVHANLQGLEIYQVQLAGDQLDRRPPPFPGSAAREEVGRAEVE